MSDPAATASSASEPFPHEIASTHSRFHLHDNLGGNFQGQTFASLASLGVELFSAGELEQEIYRRADEDLANLEVFGNRKVKEMHSAREKLQKEIDRLEQLVNSTIDQNTTQSTQLDASDKSEIKSAIITKVHCLFC